MLLKLFQRLIAADIFSIRYAGHAFDLLAQRLALLRTGVELQIQRNLRCTLPRTAKTLDVVEQQGQAHWQTQRDRHHHAGEEAADRLLAETTQAVEQTGAMAFDPGTEQRGEVRAIVFVVFFLLRWLRIGGFRRHTFGNLRTACRTHSPASPSPINRPRCRVSMR
ncbi:hypothetical protein D3C85_1207340 [compost metagenome]